MSSLSPILESRNNIRKEIDFNLLELKDNFHTDDPKKLKIKKIKIQINKLIELNRKITSNKIKSELNVKKRCYRALTSEKGIFLTASAVIWLFVMTCEAVYMKYVDKANSMLIISLMVGNIALAALNYKTMHLVGQKHKEKDRERKLLITNLQRSIENEFKYLHKFLNAFEDFKRELKDQKKNHKNLTLQIKNILKKYKKISDKNQLPSKESWISVILSLLNKSHPLKVKFEMLFENGSKSSSEDIPEQFISEKETLKLTNKKNYINQTRTIWNELENELGTYIKYFVAHGVKFTRDIESIALDKTTL